MKVNDFQKKQNKDQKITIVTCYDYPSAKIVEASDVNCVLVGDTVAMVVHGHETTITATLEMMVLHTQAVARAAHSTFVIGDLPFLSYRKSTRDSMHAVQSLMQAGAQAIKLEGVVGNEALITRLVQSGVPVMGHIGMTPQSVHALSGFRVQGRQQALADNLVAQAEQLAALGCFAVVLECVPTELGKRITQAIDIPTIGIGAGPYTDGQILVWHDMLGMQSHIDIKFVKQYMNGFETIKDALNAYCREVSTLRYPNVEQHCY